MNVSTPPAGRRPAKPSSHPSWNTHTSTPRHAPSDTAFISSAFTGTSTDPVIRNSSTNVASATTPTASGAFARMSASSRR
jgi:hypothetical protein